jgi:uncharacterized protein
LVAPIRAIRPAYTAERGHAGVRIGYDARRQRHEEDCMSKRPMKRPMLIAVAVLAATLLGSGPAAAQTPAPDALAAARELVTTMKAGDMLKSLMPVILQQLKPVIVQGRPQVERDFDAIMPTLVEAMTTKTDEFNDLVADIYARNFTAAEIREVTTFYHSPVGQKLLEKMPVISQESMMIGQKWGQAIAGDMRNRIIEELRKRGHQL